MTTDIDEPLLSVRDLVKEFPPTGKLRAAINLGNMVLAQKDPAHGEPRGITADLARELARRLGLPLELVTFDAAGKVSKMTVTDSGHKMMMKYGHPVKAGTIFYMAAGTLYMATNRPMSGGRAMLVDAIH